MKNSTILGIVMLAFTIASCKSKQALVVSKHDIVPILCGTFTTSDSSAIVVGLKLSEWNKAEMISSVDGMFLDMGETAEDKPVRPASRYFISSDTLYLEMDKGYFCYKIKDENTLSGIGHWNDGTTLIRKKQEGNDCPQTYQLTEADKIWLKQSRLYYHAYYSRDLKTSIPILERICAEGYGPACMTLGLAFLLKDREKGLSLLEKACDIGYFGNYACFRMGDVLEAYGENKAAKAAYQKSCEGGHLVGCMSAEMMGDEEE